NAARAFAQVPMALRGQLVAAIHSSFASTLDVLLIVSAILALVGGACAAAFIRPKDFVAAQQPKATSATSETAVSPA
ncbi:MAG TPA: hypothetical protein VGH31_11340, partial [Acidimicrobiales bacterium]